ncbi:uncharacterized protein LOC125767258 isoform X3 [Anopheles funestus]|uniref:uncharacterized protein LOC125767258 isoform X3 n=1 Tax=Anopheles funestus TaxID=62324 RepID=UPI0020C5DF17|nr:uncharacterized protein LOC125767258 isoform X3 [Anopheles funestus]
MRCSSCIGGKRRSHRRRNDHESTSSVKPTKTADWKPGQNMDQHLNAPDDCIVYRVESPANNHSTTFNESDDYRPPSITITELDDEMIDENEIDTSSSKRDMYEDITIPGDLVSHYHRPSRATLEIIREEELTDCSDSENSHILPSSDREHPPSQKEGNIAQVDNNTTSGKENGVAHVTTKFGSVSVLHDFLRYRRQRKRRRGTALHNAAPHFRQNEQQVPTTCLLLDAKESNIAPTEYRSICTTEIVNSEVMQAEVINIGSNSSSLDDLSDMESENREEPVEMFAQESSTTPDHKVLIDQIDGSIQSEGKPNQKHCTIVNDSAPSDATPSNHPDLHQTNEDVEESPDVSNDDNGNSMQTHVITENQHLKQNILNPSENFAALAQLTNFPRNQISDTGNVDDIATGCALAGDVGADQCERHDVATSSIHSVLHATVEKMSEHKNTVESSKPDSVVRVTLEHSTSSLLVEDRDRASVVVGNDENVIKALKDPWSSVNVRDCVPKFDIDCTVNHCVRFGKTPPLIEEIMHRRDQSQGAAIGVKKENQTFSPPSPPSQVVPQGAIPLPPPPTKADAKVTNLGQNTIESAEVDKSDTPPPAQLVPLTVEALSSSTAGVNALGKNAQALTGDHSSKTDHADANQNSTQNCFDAVTSVQPSEASKSTVDDQSALFKYIQVNGRTADPSEKHYQGNAQNASDVSPDPTAYGDCLVGDLKQHPLDDPVPVQGDAGTGEGNADGAAKIEQAHEDHGGQNCGVSSEVIVLSPTLRNTDHEILVSGTKAGMNNVARKKHPSRTVEQKLPSNTVPLLNLAADSFPPNQKQPLASDVRTEISRLKDAELEDEFRKLEIEAARFERELQQITLPKSQTSQSHVSTECTKKYYVSKQNDFVIERSSMSSVNNSNMVGAMHGVSSENHQQDVGFALRDQREQRSNHVNQDMVIKNSSSDQLRERGPIPPPPLPPIAPTNASTDNEEFFVKKVKDRVRDLMASQAAAEAAKNATKIRSAPSTPTASRKNIEAEFKEFREIRQREAVAERKLVATKPIVTSSSGPAKQSHAHTVRNFSPSRIPLATSKTSTVSHRKLNDALSTGPPVAKKPNHENKASTEENNSEQIVVNVAALIATHQEKQQLSTLPSVAQAPKIAPQTPHVEHIDSDSNDPVQHDPASDEPVVSVSDKCQQFEQRIRQNSTDSACDATPHVRKICSNSAALDGQPYQQKPGVWSPFNRSTEVLTKAELAERSPAQNEANASQQPPVWTPRSAPPSPLSERREFRRIGFESPTPTRRTITPSPADPSAVVTPPWNQPGYNPPLAVAEPSKSIPIQSSASSGALVSSAKVTTPPPPPPEQGYQQVRFPPLPRSANTQEPTINSLLKSKDGKTATLKGSEAAESLKKVSTVTASTVRTSSSLMTNNSQLGSVVNTSQTNYQNPPLRHKAEQSIASLQATTDMQDRQMQQSPANKVEGIGPISREGMPLTLRSEIDERNRDKWYKQMYQTLHKTHEDGYPYKSSGYQSEPEPNYDSDYSIKYSTLDRRRTPVGLSPTSYNKFNTLQSKPATPQQYHQQSVKSGQVSYKNQPGRIEDYTPGRSSISEKESKEWWDEVMDIFNGQLEHQKITGKTYTEGNLSRALKEQGYESDSTLVFRKREPPVSAALSPVEQKQYYKTMQAGGEIPLQGFRKPAPERPKDRNEEAIESDLLVEIKENNTSSNSNIAYAGHSTISTGDSGKNSHALENITCYPIVNIHRPLDMFGSFLKESRTFVPPVPPSRKSSRSNSTLKIMSQVKTNTFNRRTMLERTTTTTTSAGNQQAGKFRSKSAGPLSFGGATSSTALMATSASMMKEEKNQENNTRVASKRSTLATYRSSSSSPTGQQRKSSQSPVAFGRGISKERTFAEEKKRIEEKLPKIVSVSTSILRNPELKSPNEVKKALRSSYLPIVGRVESTERSSLKRFSSNGTFRSASSIYSSNKSLNRVLSPASNHRKEDKSFKISVTSTSAKGKDISHQQLQKRSLNRKSNNGRTSTPSITIKTSFQKASKAFGLKATSSSQSLARSSSTYSIESTNLKSRRSRISCVPSNTVATTRNHLQTQQRLLTGSSLDRGLKTLRTKSPTVLHHAYDQRIVQQKDNVRSDAFFQSLFLRRSQPATKLDIDEKPASVLEKARLWNNLTCRSEPSLKQSNYYLSQAKPVSSSKFKAKERQHNSELSTTYQTVREVGRDVIEQVHRFESMIKLTETQPEDQNQFGYVRGRRMEIDYSFHERSRSEPPAETTTTTTTSTTIQEELIGTDSPRTIVGRRCQVAQRTSRSPSCRRIQYLKGKEGHVKKIIRTRSLSGNTGQRVWSEKSKNELVRSRSLNLTQEPSVSRSRFRELNTFYNSLERLGQLERVTSSSSNDLRPTRRTREEEIIDYDLWKRVRDQEKAERELNQIKNKLKQDQREKDLFFLPRDPEDVRWRSDQDTGLRNREKSVEDLKCILNEQALSFEDAKLRDLENRKDYYKPLWRGSSVIDVASHLEEKYSSTGEKRDEPQSLDIISSNLLSTLSFEQMKKLKNQLSEIYSNGAQKDPTSVTRVTSQVRQQDEYIINVPERASKLESLLKVRSHSVLTQDKINESQLRTQATKFSNKTVNKTTNISTMFEGSSSNVVDRAALSRTLCQELKDKILEKHHTLPSIGKKKKNSRPSILTKEEPRFLSLESNLKKVSVDKPVQSARTTTRKESDKEFEVIIRKERPQSYCDTESISSETSNKTVIFRSQSLTHAADVPVEDIKTKIKYFEEKQILDETPTVTVYHAREDSSLSENESGTQRDDGNKVLAAKGACSSMLTLSQSFTDLKDLFGEKRSVSCSAYTASSSQDSKRASTRKLSPKRFTLRSRSSTPDYATCIQTGEVKKIKDKFESLDVNIWRQPPDISTSPERQYQSDSELSCQPSGEGDTKTHDNFGKRQCKLATGSTIVRQLESGDVSRITHKYEVQSERARSRKSRKERVTSPIPKNPFRKDDRFMPHINVISKTASLKREIKPTRVSNTHHQSAATKPAVLHSTQLPNVTATTRSASTGSCARRSASSGSEEFEKLKKSPRRYIESDVNIHYKTPVRFEYKDPIPDDELAYRQAEHMRRVYQEERRRKYMHELEDMHSRRHMDNILPSQKSPIPLNRYDDFPADLSVKPQIVQQPKTIARALYNFQGQSVRELSFRKGDIIYLRRQIDKNWYEGEHNATVGLLPANYIEILSRDNVNVRPLPKKPSREGKARAKFNFTAQTTVELSLLKGELVTLTRRVDDNWFEGKIGNKKGIFPVSYVEILTDIDGEESYDIEPIASRPQSALGVTSESSRALTTHYDNSHTNGRISPGIVRETKTIQKTEVLHVDTSNEPISYRALYNYKPQNTDELELLEGDVVYVLEKCDDGWYVGTSARSGCFGTFPGNYVTKL